MLSQLQQSKLTVHTLEQFPKEACGVLTNTDFIPCTNTAPEPRGGFEINKNEYNTIVQQHNVIGIYHSHVREPGIDYGHLKYYDIRTPTPRDAKACDALGRPYYIAGTDGETVTECVKYPGDPNAPLYGRQFIFYINDCFTLMRDYYWQKYNIKLAGHHYTFDWMNNGNGIVYPFYDRYATEWGFHEVIPEEREVGDVVIMSFMATANHIGVLLEDNMILQHIVNQPSGKVPIAHVRSHIHKFLRHRERAGTVQ